MNKQDFIDRLRMALNGRVSPGLVMDNVNYYEDYINTEIRKGRTEEEVLESLGDPRLIARTIIRPMVVIIGPAIVIPSMETENTEKQQDRRYITVITETAMANMAPIGVKWQMY